MNDHAMKAAPRKTGAILLGGGMKLFMYDCSCCDVLLLYWQALLPQIPPSTAHLACTYYWLILCGISSLPCTTPQACPSTTSAMPT